MFFTKGSLYILNMALDIFASSSEMKEWFGLFLPLWTNMCLLVYSNITVLRVNKRLKSRDNNQREAK